MKDVRVTWELPTPNPFGAELEAVEVSISADSGANYSALPEVPVSVPQELFFEQQPVGDWIIRLVVRDTAGRKSNPVDTQFLVGDDSPPGEVLNVVVNVL